jgi:acyl carrier protein phosphodiesterase
MNFLAHLYLSGSDVDIRLGNFIGDYVKGKNFDRFPEGVRKGIILHRAIDSFTDKHSSTHFCIDLLRPGYGKYAGVVVDVLFDHVLANEWTKYSQADLKSFSRSFYYQMVLRYSLLPDRVKRFLPFIIQSNRLYSYRTKEGVKKAIEIMSSVTSLPENSNYAIETLCNNYAQFSNHFNTLFPEMIEFVVVEFGIDLQKN